MSRKVGDKDPHSGAKERIEAIGQLTRTLEKLLELRRLEALAQAGANEASDAETVALRQEMLKRLKALDARRRAGPSLFDPDGTEFAGGRPDRDAPLATDVRPGTGPATKVAASEVP
ncbi:hypothetical protein [Mangrovicella endophytica]|uniref:hypothetical protein n=1 Tax=Mangrovicella endophytica TaxID=2066697 RepID=UPI0012FFD471|nr:hypothetical protein [Mangrovicella endophytica]